MVTATMTSAWNLNGEPYEVQNIALKYKNKKCFGYLLDMGLGKSAVTYSDFLFAVESGSVNGLILVCPNSLKENWEEQLKDWVPNYENINFAIWPDVPKKDAPPFIWVVNYEAFYGGKAKAYDIAKKVMEKYKVMLVLDESIVIKRHNGMPAKTMLYLGQYAKRKRILTGKPVVQGSHDLWSQLTFLEAINCNFYQFKHRFCVQGGYKGKQIVGVQNEKELNKLLTSVTYRAKIHDWTDLPKQIYIPRQLKMTTKQQKIYKQMEDDFVVQVNNEDIVAQMVVTQYGKLQQITSGFIIDESKQWHLVEENPPKLQEIHNIMDEINGKLLIPFVFKYSGAFLKAKLNDYNPAFLGGGMTKDEIKEQKDKFNNDDSCKICLIQPSSHKYGHTLLGSKKERCSTMYMYENSYSLDDRDQVERRILRHGQDADSCVYIDPYCSRMDKKVVKALQKKNNIATAIVDHCKGV